MCFADWHQPARLFESELARVPSFRLAVVFLAAAAVSLIPVAGETTWFVREGIAVDVVDVERAWSAGAEGVHATGRSSRLDAGRCVGSGDFTITARLKLDDIGKSNASLMLNAASDFESGELIFSRKGRIHVRGFFFGDRTQVLRPASDLIGSNHWFDLTVRRIGDIVTIQISDEPVWTMRYESGRPFGKMTLNPGETRMTVRSFGVRGRTRPLKEWVPLLERNHPVAGDARTDVFVSGREGYHTYRIPAIVRTTKGTLLAFAEGRKNSHHDHGDVDLVLRRSRDGGRTWLPMQRVYEEGDTAAITIGNPVPVVDGMTGRVWLFFCRDNRQVLVTHSDDDGASWRRPIDLTATLKDAAWGDWYATGPCHGIQLAGGRLVVPANHRTPQGGTQAHLIVSDDHGETWRIGGMAAAGGNETTVAALPGNGVYANMRISGHDNSKPYCRLVARSRDGGNTFGPMTFDHDLIGSICQASVLNVTGGEGDLLLFSNPQSQRRERMTVRASRDAGDSWSDGLRIYEGSSAYSDLVPMDERTAGLLFERDLYRAITFVRFRLDGLGATGDGSNAGSSSRANGSGRSASASGIDR